MDAERVQKVLARAGYGSRRAAEELVRDGRVTIDGEVAQLGNRVAPGARVCVDGVQVPTDPDRVYYLLHKPEGVMTTARDPEGRPTVLDLVPSTTRVFPVGRLDYDTAGVLLLTDDGTAANVLTHPRFGVEKLYRATLRGRLDRKDVGRVLAGVRLEHAAAAPARLRVVAVRRDVSLVDLTIHEGRNRQVRRMFEALGHPVVALTRLRFGPISLGELGPGATRGLTERELAAIRRLVAAAKTDTAGKAEAAP